MTGPFQRGSLLWPVLPVSSERHTRTHSRMRQVYSGSQLILLPVTPHCCLNLRQPSTRLNLKK